MRTRSNAIMSVKPAPPIRRCCYAVRTCIRQRIVVMRWYAPEMVGIYDSIALALDDSICLLHDRFVFFCTTEMFVGGLPAQPASQRCRFLPIFHFCTYMDRSPILLCACHVSQPASQLKAIERDARRSTHGRPERRLPGIVVHAGAQTQTSDISDSQCHRASERASEREREAFHSRYMH